MSNLYNKPSSLGWNTSAYDGISVKNMYTNPKTQRVILYGQNEGSYDNLLTCQTGVSNIDNTCMCPGSTNSTPFYVEPNNLAKLFTPEQPSMMTPLTEASKILIAERSPLQLSAPYAPYLGMCDQ